MSKYIFLFMLALYSNCLFSHTLQDSLISGIPELKEESSEEIYWEKHYYDSVAKQNALLMPVNQPFDQMIERYHSKDFEYVESVAVKLDFISNFLERIFRFIEDLFPKPSFGYYSGIYDFLAICGGILVIFFIYKFFFRGNNIFIKHKKEVESDDDELIFVEKNLMQVDVNTYIEDSLKNKNYSLAIRYQQLLNIQQLQMKGLLNWHRTKTNMELIEQVTDEKLRESFMSCTKIYDYVWFGDFVITANDYENYAKVFENFRRSWA